MASPKLIRNSIRTPDGTILTSRSVHDFVSHIDKVTREVYFLDGGLDYIRRSFNKIPAESLAVYDDEPFDVIRETLQWTSYGKDRGGPAVTRPISELDTDHIQAILDTQFHLSDLYIDCFLQELEYRKGVIRDTEES